MNQPTPANTFYRREGQTPRTENDPRQDARAEGKPTHVDGSMRSHHGPKTICGTRKVDGRSCRGKRTTTGKCFAHSR